VAAFQSTCDHSRSHSSCDQHERGIALTLGLGLAALPGCPDKLLDLVGCQVFALAQVGIDRPQPHCPVLCVGAPSRSLALAYILLSPVELIVAIVNLFRSIVQRNIESLLGPALNVYCVDGNPTQSNNCSVDIEKTHTSAGWRTSGGFSLSLSGGQKLLATHRGRSSQQR
jgi:hypothetical protein